MAQTILSVPDSNVDYKDVRNVPAIVSSLLAKTEYNNETYVALVLSQWYHESLWWKNSGAGADYKAKAPWFNCMGMRPAVQRTTYRNGSINSAGNYASYANYADCLMDLVEWWRAKRVPTNFQGVSEYATFIREKGYFTGPLQSYIKGMMNAWEAYGMQWAGMVNVVYLKDESSASAEVQVWGTGSKKKVSAGLVAFVGALVLGIVWLYKKYKK